MQLCVWYDCLGGNASVTHVSLVSFFRGSVLLAKLVLSSFGRMSESSVNFARAEFLSLAKDFGDAGAVCSFCFDMPLAEVRASPRSLLCKWLGLAPQLVLPEFRIGRLATRIRCSCALVRSTCTSPPLAQFLL